MYLILFLLERLSLILDPSLRRRPTPERARVLGFSNSQTLWIPFDTRCRPPPPPLHGQGASRTTRVLAFTLAPHSARPSSDRRRAPRPTAPSSQTAPMLVFQAFHLAAYHTAHGTFQPPAATVLASDLTLDGDFKTKEDRAVACPVQWLPVILAGAPPEKSMQMIRRHIHDASASRPLHVKVAVLNAHLEGNLGDEV